MFWGFLCIMLYLDHSVACLHKLHHQFSFVPHEIACQRRLRFPEGKSKTCCSFTGGIELYHLGLLFVFMTHLVVGLCCDVR